MLYSHSLVLFYMYSEFCYWKTNGFVWSIPDERSWSPRMEGFGKHYAFEEGEGLEMEEKEVASFITPGESCVEERIA